MLETKTTKVMPCNCVQATDIVVKSGSGSTTGGTKPRMAQRIYPLAGAEFQDKKYGKGNRLHNIGRRGKEVSWTCTICGNRKS